MTNKNQKTNELNYAKHIANTVGADASVRPQKQNGITLIALVITIIVMLILVGVTVSIAINGGLFGTAKSAARQTQIEQIKELVQLDIVVESEKNGGKLTKNSLKGILDKYFTDIPDVLPEDLKGISATTKEEYGGIKNVLLLDIYSGIYGDISVAEIFDPNGKNETDLEYDATKLHIGDFINYDAGTWTEEEIKEIQVGLNTELASTSSTIPDKNFQFGGFTVGTSRNENAPVAEINTTYNYLKGKNEEEITGWRLFDVKEDGSIVLISAGCPEVYYREGENAYASEYVLTGNINSGATALNINTNYTKRNWENYLNKEQKATKATPLTNLELDNWYKKYMGVNSNSSNFQSIYNTRYETIIDNYSCYYLCTSHSSSLTYSVSPMSKWHTWWGGGANGIRILVTLSPDIKLSEESVGTVTIVDPRNDEHNWSYNVWNLK